MNALAVGGILRLLQALIKGLKLPLEAVLHLGGDSYPLALAIGNLITCPVRHWDNRSGQGEMLVLPRMENLEEAGIRPVNRSECALLFCFQVSPLRDYALLPELIGVISHPFPFPWQERVEVIPDAKDDPMARGIPSYDSSFEAIARELVKAALLLPEDAKAPKLIAFYRAHRDTLICCHPERFPERRYFHPFTPG
jgi:hypothetical protein